MDSKLLAQFVAILGALSPENLMCDGERSYAAARRVERSLKARWKALEKELGRKVAEDEVWTEFLSKRPSRVGATFGN